MPVIARDPSDAPPAFQNRHGLAQELEVLRTRAAAGGWSACGAGVSVRSTGALPSCVAATPGGSRLLL